MGYVTSCIHYVMSLVWLLLGGCQGTHQEQPKAQSRVAVLDSLQSLSVGFIFDQEYAQARVWLDSLDYLTLQQGDSLRWAQNQSNYGLLAYFQSNYFESAQYYAKTISYATAHRDSLLASATYKNLGITYRKLGQFESAISQYHQALRYLPMAHPPYEAAALYNSLGNLYMAVEDYTAALPAYEQALTLWQSAKKEKRLGTAYHNLGEVYRRLGNTAEAATFFSEALEVKERMGDPHRLAFTLQGLGHLAIDKDQLTDAKGYLNRSWDLFQQVKDRQEVAQTSLYLAEAYRQESHWDSVAYWLNYSDSLVEYTGSRALRADWLALQKAYAMATKDWEHAWALDTLLGSLEDSLFQKERLRIVELRNVYRLEQETERVERAEAQRKRALSQSKRRQRVAIVISGIAVLLLITLYIINRQRKRIRQLNVALERMNYDIRHRKKNDYLRILAYFSASREYQPVLAEVLQPLENMLMASAQVDDMLYGTPIDQKIPLQPYLSELLLELDQTLSLNHPWQVSMKTEIDDTSLPAEQATKLAFIVAEWVTNAYKHAFSGEHQPAAAQLHILIQQVDTQMQVELTDNGRGVTEAKLEASTGLGWILVKGFIENLRGTFSLTNQEGTQFKLSFPCL